MCTVRNLVIIAASTNVYIEAKVLCPLCHGESERDIVLPGAWAADPQDDSRVVVDHCTECHGEGEVPESQAAAFCIDRDFGEEDDLPF